MRPSTLHEVSERIVGGEDPTRAFSEFLDHFYEQGTTAGMAACFQQEPLLLDAEHWNAIFAATAVYLSNRYRLGSIP